MYVLNDEGKKKLKGHFKPKQVVNGVTFYNKVVIVQDYPECFDLEPAELDLKETQEDPVDIKGRVERINNKKQKRTECIKQR